MRQLPFFKRKKGWSVAGTGEVYGDSGGGSAYELPTASADTKGGVKIGSGLTMDGEVLSADAYTLPTAAADTKGGVKIGSNLSMTGEVLSADVSQTDVNTRLKKVSTMPTASADNLGDIVIYTGATDATYTNGYAYKCVSDGGDPATYSWTASPVQADYNLPAASASTLGGVKIGAGLEIDNNGVLSSTGIKVLESATYCATALITNNKIALIVWLTNNLSSAPAIGDVANAILGNYGDATSHITSVSISKNSIHLQTDIEPSDAYLKTISSVSFVIS